jgi:membrane protease YdiL (CAAX protease family)
LANANYQLSLFVGIDAFFIFFFLLKSFPVQADFNTALVFASGYAAAVVAILFIAQNHRQGISQVIFDRDLTGKDAKLTLGLAAAILIVMAFNPVLVFDVVARGSSLSVGIPSQVSDAIYNLMLTAPAEELLVLALILAFVNQDSYKWLKDPYAAAGVARFGWALLHTILAYGNSISTVAILFALGFSFTLVGFRTKSVLSPIILHGTWNAGIILIPWLMSGLH